MKGIETAFKTLFIVIVFFITIFFSIIFLWNYISNQASISIEQACKAKVVWFCSEWAKTNFQQKPDWNSIKPENCEEVGINEPSLEECTRLIE